MKSGTGNEPLSNALRVTQTGSDFAVDYSLKGGTSWHAGPRFTQQFTVREAGMHLTDSGTNPATTARFDYFTIQQ